MQEETEAQRGVVTCLRPPSWRGRCRSAPKAWLSSRCRAQEPHPELPTLGAQSWPPSRVVSKGENGSDRAGRGPPGCAGDVSWGPWSSATQRGEMGGGGGSRLRAGLSLASLGHGEPPACAQATTEDLPVVSSEREHAIRVHTHHSDHTCAHVCICPHSMHRHHTNVCVCTMHTPVHAPHAHTCAHTQTCAQTPCTHMRECMRHMYTHITPCTMHTHANRCTHVHTSHANTHIAHMQVHVHAHVHTLRPHGLSGAAVPFSGLRCVWA